MKRILVLSPHADDESIGAGGSISKWVREGNDVRVALLSLGTSKIEEFHAATARLGCEENLVGCWPTRRFDEHRQDILDWFVSIRDVFRPDLVVCPASDDVHQDHKVVHEEAVRAFLRNASIVGYDFPWNNCQRNTLYVKLDERALVEKLRAMECYGSQRDRPYMDRSLTCGIARLRGMMSGNEWAESFEIVRWNDG